MKVKKSITSVRKPTYIRNRNTVLHNWHILAYISDNQVISDLRRLSNQPSSCNEEPQQAPLS